ncbi:helicase HerA-like domain-containing protein [Guggenheimella bovis]
MNIGLKDGQFITFDESMATRHALIAGATGTGKTVTIKLLSEEFSKQGVPVFITDIKGDLSGFMKAGSMNPKLEERLQSIGAPTPTFESFPTVFWDIYKTSGVPLRTTISEMGPLLLSRLLNLNEVQTGVLYIVFKIADEEGLLLLDFKDLQKMLLFVQENRKELSEVYGNIQAASIGAIQRALLILEQQGASDFFQEPALDIRDFLRTEDGKGVINILDARKIYLSPDLYSAFILYLLSEFYENLPEVGDNPLPKLVFIFEEAHLIFQNASKALLEKIEQVVKLVRSKGVAIFFSTQNPRDIPDNVLAQIGNRIQHALRAFTPAEQRVVRSIADTFRQEEGIDMFEELLNLKIGQAIISTLDIKGQPSVAQKAYILAPASAFEPCSADEVDQTVRNSFCYSKYEKSFDSESAYELLTKRMEEMQKEKEKAEEAPKEEEKQGGFFDGLFKSRSRSDSPLQRMVKNAMGSIGSQIGRNIVRGIFGNMRK